MLSQRFLTRALVALMVLVFLASPLQPAQRARAQEGRTPQLEEIRSTTHIVLEATDKPELVERGHEEASAVTVSMTPQRVSESCWIYVWDPRQAAVGSWDLIGWSALTDGRGLADWGRDGASVHLTIIEDPVLGSPTQLTFSGAMFNLDANLPGARIEFEPVRNGSNFNFEWYADSQNMGDPAYFQVEAYPRQDLYTANGLVVRTGGGRQVGWDYLRLFKCYDGVPVVTPTPTPTATPSPTPTPPIEESIQLKKTPAPVVVHDGEDDICKIAAFPSVGGSGQARVLQSPDSFPFGPQIPALGQCYSPSQVATIPPGSCFMPKRKLVVKEAVDGSLAWEVQFQCPTQSAGGVMMTSTEGAPVVGPLIGFAAFTMMTLLGAPNTVEVVWEPLAGAIAREGSFFADSVEEGLDAVLALAAKPATQYLGSPSVYIDFFTGTSEIEGMFRGYRFATNWEENVWIYPGDAPIDGDTVASLQYFVPGSRGPMLKTAILKNVPNGGGGFPLWDATAQLFLQDYPTEPLLPGVPPRTGIHSDKTPSETARKSWAWAQYMNRNRESVLAGIRPPHNWCGIRDEDDTCVCVSYVVHVFKWIVNGAGKVKFKSYEGAALMWNRVNPTVLMGLQKTVAGAADYTDDAKPLGAQFQNIRTFHPDTASQSDLDKCPDHFGLRLAGRAADQGIPDRMLPHGGEIQ